MSNLLKNQTSPYLLQHADNPVYWYPWCDEAFQKAKTENKPIFLSIGYSTCHWCHVMAHESFEDEEIAQILNQSFLSIKVDKEERPDIDSIYMAVCQTLTGSGGWPTSIFMTPEQKPFYAGTYFPKETKYRTLGFKQLLTAVRQKWENSQNELIDSANEIVSSFQKETHSKDISDKTLIESAVESYKQSYDKEYGGFGSAPKFPAPHNLLFLLQQYEKNGDNNSLEIAEHTLLQLYKGGIFDHIGYGFSRYSTDRYFLIPHFEKMLYDNALLILAYCKAYSITKKTCYRQIAEKTAYYILREMTSPQGGFYSAEDADSDGKEGKFYAFDPAEIISILGKDNGQAFNQHYSITNCGNFEGQNIPNLLNHQNISDKFGEHLSKIYDYRKQRTKLHLDDKILTSWNSIMIAAMCWLYRISQKTEFLEAGIKAQTFIETHLQENDTLFVSFREGRRNQKGFLDDYAYQTFALLSLYDATLNIEYLEKAQKLLKKTVSDFFDTENGGFYLYGKDHETLIIRPKDCYDGAMPSGNSIMAYNLVRLFQLIPYNGLETVLKRQLDFMYGEAKQYPTGFAMFLTALSDYLEPTKQITAVLKNKDDIKIIPFQTPLDSTVRIMESPTDEYKMIHDKTTYYVCRAHCCLEPVNDLTLSGK